MENTSNNYGIDSATKGEYTMSMAGEIENIDHEIKQIEIRLESLRHRRTGLMDQSRFDFPNISRIEVINSEGRAWVAYLDEKGVDVQIQDGDRTMKVFYNK